MSVMKEDKKELSVAAICNGTVIDHIPPDKLFNVASLLHLEDATAPITIGNNFAGHKQGKKGIIKIADRFFEDDILNRIALVAPNVTLNIIKEYKVVEKKRVDRPKEVIGIVRCPNAKCITNNEPMLTRFESVTDGTEEVLVCSYCGRKVKDEQIELQ